MARFVVRIDLHKNSWAAYALLHDEMEERGFSRTIAGSDGVQYRLPPGQYSFEGNLTRDQVLDKAWEAAGEVSTAHAIVVTEGRSEWRGLKKA